MFPLVAFLAKSHSKFGIIEERGTMHKDRLIQGPFRELGGADRPIGVDSQARVKSVKVSDDVLAV